MYRSYSVVGGGESGGVFAYRAGEASLMKMRKRIYPFAPWGDAVINSLPFAF